MDQAKNTSLNAPEKKGLLYRFFMFPLVQTKHGSIRVENLPWFLFHLSFVAAFFVEFSWDLVALAAGLYFVRMFAVTGIYHRYFSHRGYKIKSRVVQFIWALWGTTAVQQGPIWWANHHRHHHRYSDTEKDLHSPKQHGFWHSHVLWIFTLQDRPDYEAHQYDRTKDLTKYPELVFIDKHYWIGPTLMGIALFAMGGLPYLVWGLGISTVLLYHGTFTINSLSHVFGSRRYDTGDTSRNNLLLAFVTLGEGWHNNHHQFAGGAKAGFYWWEVDITYYCLWMFEKLGLISELGAPPAKVIDLGRENDRLRREARQLVRAGVVRRLSVEELYVLVEKLATCVDQGILKKLNLQDLRNLISRVAEGAQENWKHLVQVNSVQPA